jgi:hypothetical protein
MTFQPQSDSPPVEAVLVRIDPNRYTFRIAYDPDNPSTVSEWQTRTGGLVVINAGFFQPDYQTAGLLAVDGEIFGLSFDQIDAQEYGFTGMFSVVGGLPGLRKLGTVPYQPGEPLDQAVQGLPMLLEAGGVPVSFDLPDRSARRTVIARSTSGAVLDQPGLGLDGLPMQAARLAGWGERARLDAFQPRRPHRPGWCWNGRMGADVRFVQQKSPACSDAQKPPPASRPRTMKMREGAVFSIVNPQSSILNCVAASIIDENVLDHR